MSVEYLSLPFLPDALRAVVLVRVIYMSQVDLFKNYLYFIGILDIHIIVNYLY